MNISAESLRICNFCCTFAADFIIEQFIEVTYTLIVILVVLLVLSYLLSHHDLFNPALLTSALWLAGVAMFQLLPNSLPPLHKQFLLSLILWSIGLVLGALVTQSCNYRKHKWQCSGTIKDLYFWLSILCIPLLINFVYQAITYGTSGNIAMDLRMATLGSNSHMDGDVYTPLYYVLWVVTYLLYLIDVDRYHWRRATIMGSLVLLFSIATMSKALILTFGLMTLYILFRKKFISTRVIVITGACLLVVMLVIHAIRQSQTMDEEQVVSIFEQYILRGFCAYDTLTPRSSENWGENVFRLYYAVSYKLGLSNIEPINPLLPWVSKPAPTNTYSTLYPFFKDFGYAGVGGFSVLLGLMLGVVYKKAQTDNSFFIILYAYVLIMVIMQYAAEYFFTNLAGHIKFVAILAVPYIVGTNKLLVKNA